MLDISYNIIPKCASSVYRCQRTESGKSSLHDLSSYKRIVVKIGSALIADPESGVRQQWLRSLASDIAELRRCGIEVCVVSSGAIPLGRMTIGSNSNTASRMATGVLTLDKAQAAAAIGQIELVRTYGSVLGEEGLLAAQILLTIEDTRDRRRYLNARDTIETLLSWNSIPVINENDTVATTEIRYGDNDRLAARVTSMIGADLLLLLSDIDGLYSVWPPESEDAKPIERVKFISPEIEAMAGDAESCYSSGGMKTKIAAAKIATAGGAAMVIASGRDPNPLRRLSDGGSATWFDPVESPVNARKKWIVGQINVNGKITIDTGAAKALRGGKSLLPAGVTAIAGDFSRGDTVAVLDRSGNELARGLIAFDVSDATMIIGQQSSKIAELLGAGFRTEMIHRDDLVVH